MQLKFGENERESRSSAPEIVIKILLAITFDYVCTTYIPLSLYGTKQVGMVPDLLIKKVLNITVVCLLFNSQELDGLLQQFFRPEKNQDKISQQ